MITASKARELSGPSVDDQVKAHLEKLDKAIKSAAANHKRQVTIRSEPFARWSYNLSNPKCEVSKLVFEELKKNGFELDCYYKELQFVDIALIIKW